LAARLGELAGEGRVVVVATHDVEFVAGVAHRVVVLAGGEVVADGTTADVVVASPSFAPQVAKVLHPDPWLTVEQVADGLARAVAAR
jgi:energy-coupling factor transport system ATP-binding protein